MNKQKILDLMSQADRMLSPRRYSKTVVCVFDKANPTLWSFQAAAMKLGCQVLTLPGEQSHAARAYGEVVVLDPETSQNQEVDRLAELYALYRELDMRCIDLDSIDRPTLQVVFLGDGPSVQPFVQVLNHFPRIDCRFVSMEEMTPELFEETDVFYVSKGEIDRTFLEKTKHSAIVMRTHPYAPCTMTHNPRCIYSAQETHGVRLRMAILDKSLSQIAWPSLYEAYWMAIDWASDLAVHYIVKGWSILTGSPLVRTGV